MKNMAKEDLLFLENGRVDEVAEQLAIIAETLCPPGQLFVSVALKKARKIIKSRPVGYYYDLTLNAGPQPRSKG